jgi:hypothetical protein
VVTPSWTNAYMTPDLTGDSTDRPLVIISTPCTAVLADVTAYRMRMGVLYDFRSGGWRLCVVERWHDNEYLGQLVTLDVGVGEVTATAHHSVWVVSGDSACKDPKTGDWSFGGPSSHIE